MFMPYVGGVAAYKRKCDEIAARGYEGFRLGAGIEEQRQAEPGAHKGVMFLSGGGLGRPGKQPPAAADDASGEGELSDLVRPDRLV